MAEYRGIDVSHHNGTIDWAKVKASGNVDFAIIRSGYGWTDGDIESQRDKRFWENVKGCEANGIPYGIYHYSYCTDPNNAHKEAEYFLKLIKGTKPSYPVWFDIEDESHTKLSKADLTKITDTFCSVVEKAGYYVGVYSYKAFLEQKLDMISIGKYDVWVAHINTAKTNYGGNYGMWQYSWKGSVAGIEGDVDLNIAYRDYPAIIKEHGLNGFEEAETEKEEIVKEWTEIEILRAENEELKAMYAELLAKIDSLIDKLESRQ